MTAAPRSPVRRLPASSRSSRAAAARRPRRIRVVEVLATGTNGGAQEHLYSLVTRMDRDALRRLGRVAVARQRRPQAPAGRASPSASSTTWTTRSPSGRSRPTSPRSGPTSSTTTCTAPRSSAPRPPGASREAGLPRPYVVGTVHSARIRDDEDRAAPADADPADGPPHRGLARRSCARSMTRAATGAPVTPDLQRRRPRALRPAGAVLHAPRGVRHGARAPDRRRRGAPGAREGAPDPAGGLAAGPRRCPSATSSSSARARAGRRSRPRPPELRDRPIGSSSPAGATTSRP